MGRLVLTMAKDRFWLTSTNARGRETGQSLDAGRAVHARGWDAGVQVIPRPDGDTDTFDVWMTGGTHRAGRDVHIGTVRDTPQGPVWVPAELPAGAAIPDGAG